ncbi:HD domain-containing protein [Streptomyces sp. RY43-2]|uniref:HD domain-containing protein n=1 Tax=Streptomyces macrolidinus TaxID=2952607 RepID=A0ABT0ZCJ6_9ACTN|nr:HD domain-containing protein [Streptomyces macrolidinus]MCN9241347.1 HD domain-containing protein [Streptomyces macrolidinus]
MARLGHRPPTVGGLAPEVSAQRLGEAVSFAEEAHGDQKRPAGEPYGEHLLEVVEILVSGAGVRDEDLLIAAVLHDVVEDTDRTAGEVGEQQRLDTHPRPRRSYYRETCRHVVPLAAGGPVVRGGLRGVAEVLPPPGG